MTWGRFDDNTDDELAFLSHEAFRLYLSSVTYSRRNNRAGRLHHQRDVVPHAAKQRIKRLAAAIAELMAGTDDDPPLWERDGEFYVIRGYPKFNPLTSAERMRRHRNRHSDAHVTSLAVTGDAPRASARALGTPIPVPVPSESPSEPRTARARRSRWIGRGFEPCDVYHATLVGLHLTPPTDEVLGVVWKKATDELGSGRDLADVIEGCRRAAIKNEYGLIPRHCGDAERERKGISTTDTAAREGPAAPRPPRVEMPTGDPDWEGYAAGFEVVRQVLEPKQLGPEDMAQAVSA